MTARGFNHTRRKSKSELEKEKHKVNFQELIEIYSSKSCESSKEILIFKYRDVAQLGSASALGAGCHRFKSCHPDRYFQELILLLNY